MVQQAAIAAGDAIKEVERRWNAAASTWDVDGLAAIYTDDALMYGGRTTHSVGNDGVRAYFASYVGMLAAAKVTLVSQEIRQLGPGTILAQGYGAFDLTLADGRRSQTTLRTTWVLVNQSGTWKILQHHFSAIPEAPPIPR